MSEQRGAAGADSTSPGPALGPGPGPAPALGAATEWTPVNLGGDQPRVVLLLSGPNLNLLGEREPAIYGTDTLDDHVESAIDEAAKYGLVVEHVQSNHEGDLVDAVHWARERASAIVVNPGAITHYGWSLHDALASFDGPIVELHLSNPAGREPWRRTSVVATVATGTIAGFGGLGYRLAIEAVADLLG